MKKKKIYSRTHCCVVDLVLTKCPRCRGFGGVFPTDNGDPCSLCKGEGEIWYNYDNGVALAKWARADAQVIY